MTFPRVLLRWSGMVDRAALRRPGRGSLAVLEHVGRRSGDLRHTPVRAFRCGDAVVIGANFGERSDWVRNLQAAGGGRIRLRRQWLTLGAPALVPVREGVRGMPWWFGLGLRYLVRTKVCVRMPVLTTAG